MNYLESWSNEFLLKMYKGILHDIKTCDRLNEVPPEAYEFRDKVAKEIKRRGI